jgi:hypothetical protein
MSAPLQHPKLKADSGFDSMKTAFENWEHKKELEERRLPGLRTSVLIGGGLVVLAVAGMFVWKSLNKPQS